MKNLAATAFPGRLRCRHGAAWRVLLATVWLAAANGALAQATSSEAAQYQRIAIEREQAEAEFVQRQWLCSRRFVVTACVDQAKAKRRSSIDALNHEADALDSARRQARADRRLAIIKEKTEAFAKLKPLADEPGAASRSPAPVPALSQTRDMQPGKRDSAAPDAAAAQRAQASARRRAEARQRQVEREARNPSQKSPASSLPARPRIPPPEAASAPSK